MHPNRRVDPLELQKLAESGKSGREIAQILGVSPPAVSRNLKALGLAKNGDIVLRAARKINQKKLDAMGQLEKINRAIERQLDEIQGELEMASGEQKAGLRDAQIKHTAEIRKQLDLLLQIGKALYNIEEVAAFQKLVLEEIGNESPECRSRILKRLQQRRSTSGLPGFSQHIV
jgi:predicted transcriptional regulator